MLLYICFNCGDKDSVNYYHDTQCIPSHVGEKPFRCIVSTVSYILVKTYECQNKNIKSDKLCYCTHDELCFIQIAVALKCKSKVAGYKIPTSLLMMAIHKRGNNIRFENYYHIIQYFLSYLGEKPCHCIVSMFLHILEKTHQCRNINIKSVKLYQCIYDETYFIQNIFVLKCICKHTGERMFISFDQLAIYKRSFLGRKTFHTKPCHNMSRYALNTSEIHILLHTDLMLDLVNILYRIGRSIFITVLQHVR